MRWMQSLWILLVVAATLFAAEGPSLFVHPVAPSSAKQLVSAVQLMGFLQKKYTPEVQKKGDTFVWKFDWAQSYVGAGSGYTPETKQFYILLHGGQVRSSSFEALAFTLCHEWGHYLAGPPYQKLFGKAESWSSAEGQADWFAAKECLPEVFQEFSSQHPKLLTYHDEKTTKALCASSKNQKRCQWILGAGQSFASAVDHLYEKDLLQPSLLKKAFKVVETTLDSSYPGLQCRLDTVKEAAFCSDRECSRPKCWFKNK